MFNEDQRSYMKYLATVPASKKCYCAWYMADECPNCKGRGTLEDRLKVQCPACHNYPHLGGKPTITHNIKCSTPDWQPTPLARYYGANATSLVLGSPAQQSGANGIRSPRFLDDCGHWPRIAVSRTGDD